MGIMSQVTVIPLSLESDNLSDDMEAASSAHGDHRPFLFTLVFINQAFK